MVAGPGVVGGRLVTIPGSRGRPGLLPPRLLTESRAAEGPGVARDRSPWRPARHGAPAVPCASRSEPCGCFGPRRDAQLGWPMPSWPLLRLPRHPASVAGGSAYAALAAGGLHVDPIRDAVAGCRLGGGQPNYAVELGVWPTSNAEASPERSYYY